MCLIRDISSPCNFCKTLRKTTQEAPNLTNDLVESTVSFTTAEAGAGGDRGWRGCLGSRFGVGLGEREEGLKCRGAVFSRELPDPPGTGERTWQADVQRIRQPDCLCARVDLGQRDGREIGQRTEVRTCPHLPAPLLHGSSLSCPEAWLPAPR